MKIIFQDENLWWLISCEWSSFFYRYFKSETPNFFGFSICTPWPFYLSIFQKWILTSKVKFDLEGQFEIFKWLLFWNHSRYFHQFFSAIFFDKLHFIIKDFWHVKPKCIFYIVLIHKSFLTSLAIISNFFQISVPLLWMIVVQVKIISIMPICTRWNCNGLSFWNLYSQHIICHCRIDN